MFALAQIQTHSRTMHQYIHKVSNTSIMSPTDIWKLSDPNIKPQKGWQVAAGIYHETARKVYEFSAEVYYKYISDYLNYRSSAVLLMNPHLETDVISTKGQAYGIELQAKKPTGRLNGWMSYTSGHDIYNGILSFVTRSGRLTNYPTEPNTQYLVYDFP